MEQEASTDPGGGRIGARTQAVAASWGIAGLLAGAAIGALLLSNAEERSSGTDGGPRQVEETLRVAEETTLPDFRMPPDRPEIEFSPEVDEWHEGAAPFIGNVVGLSISPPEAYSQFPLATMCLQLSRTLSSLERQGPPPDERLSELLQVWIRTLEEAQSECESYREETVDPGMFAIIMLDTAPAGDAFLRELDRRVDLSRMANR